MTSNGQPIPPAEPHQTAAGQARRREILGLASELFRDMGYHSATMDKIAEISGLAKPTLYHYFRSKEEILFDIHLLYITPLIDSQRDRVERGVSSSRVAYEIIAEHLRVVVENPGMLQSFMEHQRELSKERRLEMRENRGIYRRLVEDSFRRDIDLGVIPACDTRTVAFSLFGMCNWGARAHSHLKPEEVDALAKELWQLFVFGTIGPRRAETDPKDFD
jgi:TetR/AcrR family transcriptional regulator, cholesterol catabolism regulator